MLHLVAHDVDLLREILLYLEGRQASPRAPVIIDIRGEADEIGLDPATFSNGLNLLQDYEYIEGPGQDSSSVWLFRKLTRKGVEFVRASRDPWDWEQMKLSRTERA